MPKLLRLCLWQVVFISIISFHFPASAYEAGGIRMRGDKKTDTSSSNNYAPTRPTPKNSFSFDKYGPITSKDTLWSIALTIRPDSSLSIYQVMQALYQANPQAFSENNRNHIIEGKYLTIPPKTQMMATNALAALTKSDQDDINWQNKTTGISKNKKSNINKKDLDTVKSEINNKLEKIDTAQQQRLSSIQNDVLDSIDGLQSILKENRSLNQKLTSFDEQLGLMQTEVAKGKEMKLQMDDMLRLQQELLEKANARENALLLEKEKTELAEQGVTSNLWFLVLMVTVSISVMLGVLFFVLRRKKSPEEATFDEVKLNSQNNITETIEDVEDELSLDAELSLDDDLSIDLLEGDDDVIHLDIGDDDELDGLDTLDDLDELDDLDDIILDNDELEGDLLEQDDLDSLLSGIDESDSVETKSEPEPEPLDNGLLDQSALDDLLNGEDDSESSTEEISIDKDIEEAADVTDPDVTDPDDIDALLDSIGVDAGETEATADVTDPDVTDPDDIDALLDSIGVDASETAAATPVEESADVTDPDDIDALLDSIGVDASETAAATPVEESADVTDPDDIDALLDSIGVDASETAAATPVEEPVDITDPDDIDALLDSIGVDASETEAVAPAEEPVDITDPDDIDALLDSIGVDASETEAAAPAEEPADVTDPDDIDALLDSIGVDASETEATAPVEESADVTDPDDIDALLDSIGVDASETEAVAPAEEPVDITDPDDIDALLDSIGVDASETAAATPVEESADVTDPDDIDALLDSIGVDASETEAAAPADVTDPDDIDALLDSIGVDASETEATAPVEESADVTDPDDIDALLDSIGVDASETEAVAPAEEPVDITDPDDIDALLDSIGVDASETKAAASAEETVEITNPDDIDELLKSMDIESEVESTKTSSDLQESELLENTTEEKISENKEKIENLTQEYVAPLLSADFSKIVNKSNKQALGSDLDMEKLLSESSEDDSEGSLEKSADESDTTLELIPDFTDKNVLAELLDGNDDKQKNETIEASVIDDIQELDNLDFDELLANIEEESSLSTNTDDFNEDLDVGDVISVDDNVEVKNDEDFRSVDSILAESMDADTTEEPYNKTNIDVGLNEFKELTTETESFDVDEDNGIAAKLELANVYVEIGDEDNAKVMLLDVVKSGDTEQQKEAQKILDSL